MNVLDYLENAAAAYPQRVALEDISGQLTYEEFKNYARKVGLFLMEKGFCRTHKPIGVEVTRDKYTLVLYMGILYSGNYYIPIDPDMKQEKKDKIIKQSGMELILSVVPSEEDSHEFEWKIDEISMNSSKKT